MDPASVGDEVGKIVQSQTFANKKQLKKLLEILFRNMNSQVTLTPDLVIEELWPGEVRTKRAADVATEMNRLRHALKAYYQGEGANDPVIIILPNRAPAAGNGTHERAWMTAQSSADLDDSPAEEQLPGWQVQSQETNFRKGLKRAAMIAAAAAALGVAVSVSKQVLARPEQPKSGRLDSKALVVMNSAGRELWRKTFPQGFGPDSYYDEKEFGPHIWFADLEGKGRTSVLFSYLPAADSQPHSSTLICYSDRGREKWRWTPGKELPEVVGLATYKTLSLGILKAREKTASRIVVVSDHDPWWGGPSQIAILDSNGKTISEYWHSGGLHDVTVADLDGDGREEIVATGVAHGCDQQATLVVLDADRASGASKEVQTAYQIGGMGLAQERLRLLFPRSDLNRASFQFNSAMKPAVENGKLRVMVLECLAPKGCPIWYELDKNVQLIAAYAGNNEFRAAHDRLYQNGKDAHTLTAEEQAEFLKVRCLEGCKTEFVPVVQTHNPATSFENGWNGRTNPNGVWSYGYSSGFTGPITLYDKAVQNGINGQNAQYWLSSSVNSGTSPAVEYNNGPAYNDGNVKFLQDEFLLVAGIRGEYSDLIFAAPASGEYSVAGNFRGAQYDVGTVAGVVANGKLVFNSKITAVDQIVPFNIKLRLLAGSKIVFSVGPGSGSQNTGLSTTIMLPCAPTDSPAPTLNNEVTCSGPATSTRASIKKTSSR